MIRSSLCLAAVLAAPALAPAEDPKPPTPRFARADADADGRLSRAEWTAAMPRDAGARLFERIDTDGDGFVGAEEAAALAARAGARFERDESDLADIAVTRDVPYAVRQGFDPKLTSLDVYAPRDGERHPVVVMIHGGGWRMGDKDNGAGARTKARFFVERGYVFVSINYRLSPEVVHPAHVEDVAAAIAWVHDHVADYGGDPAALFVMGHSAGAHLAALVATDERRLAAHEKPLSIVRGIVLLDGAGYDVARAARTLGGNLMPMYRDAFGEDEAGWKDASPLHHLAAGKGIPPALVFYTGGGGPRAKLIESFAAAIAATGAAAEAIPTEQDHAAINREFGTPGDAVTERTIEFFESIRRALAPKRQV